MRIGFIGLGRMGAPMVLRLIKAGHQAVVYNRSPEKVRDIVRKGAIGASSYPDLLRLLGERRIIWLMVPHKAVDEVIAELLPKLRKGDILIDGGNSNFHESVRRSEELRERGIVFMDIGVSGGVAAAKTGYCMMVGGDKQAYAKLLPLLKAMCMKDGFGHMGPSGAGHYVKMVHNAIEYGMMEALGEGYELLARGPYKGLDMKGISRVWNHGSIVRSFLLEMIERALEHHPGLEGVSGYVADNGEGRWAVEEAMRHDVPFTINSHALFARYRSRETDTVANRLVAAMRDEFGAHGLGKDAKRPGAKPSAKHG